MAWNVSRYFPDNFMQSRCSFFICARNSDEYFHKFIASRFLNFSRFIFIILSADQKFKMQEVFIPIQITAIIIFFMLCSYKNSCFCFLVIKINVMFKVNTLFFLLTLLRWAFSGVLTDEGDKKDPLFKKGILPKEDSKICGSRDTLLELC